MARGLLTAETRRRLYEEDAKWPLKAILRIIATASAFLAMILLAASVSLTNTNFVDHDGRRANDWMDGMALAPVLLSLIYNPFSLLVLLLRCGKHLHPAFHLTIDLAIWALSIPAIIFTVAGGLFWYWKPAISDSNGNVDCGFFFNEFSKECDPVAYTIGHMEVTGIVFLFIVLVLHFILFIVACIDTHKWRRISQIKGVQKHIELQYKSNPDCGSQQPPRYGSSEKDVGIVVTRYT